VDGGGSLQWPTQCFKIYVVWLIYNPSNFKLELNWDSIQMRIGQSLRWFYPQKFKIYKSLLNKIYNLEKKKKNAPKWAIWSSLFPTIFNSFAHYSLPTQSKRGTKKRSSETEKKLLPSKSYSSDHATLPNKLSWSADLAPNANTCHPTLPRHSLNGAVQVETQHVYCLKCRINVL
jgi:hypothetical protein